MMIKEAIRIVARGDSLTETRMQEAMEEIITGRATPVQTGSLMTALRIKGETVDEITGAARAVRTKAPKIRITNHVVNMDRDEINLEEETILDTCETGGGGTRTFNVSTATALVAAGAGVGAVKYGSRNHSGPCGSAEVIEALGVNLEMSTTEVERCLLEAGIGFLYAPLFQGAMKFSEAPRREIGIRTLFNLVGPLTNPSRASVQVLGVYSPDLTEKMARVLRRLGIKEAFVVCGEETLDEISICGVTRVSRLRGQKIESFETTPEDHGLERAQPEAIRGGNARENARIIRRILEGEKGPARDVVLLNAAAAFVASGLDRDFRAGTERAGRSIDSGAARDKLERLIRFTTQCRAFVLHEPFDLDRQRSTAAAN